MSVAPIDHRLVASAVSSVAFRVKAVLMEFARSTRTLNGVARENDVVPLTVFVTPEGTEPLYMLTVPKGKDAVLVPVPVTARPPAAVTKVKLIDPATSAVTPRVPEPV
jgi:hypothetical protein